MKRVCLALDIGGTKINAALVNADGEMLRFFTCPTAAHLGRDHVLAATVQCLDALYEEIDPALHTVAGLGISSAGVIDTVQGSVMDATDAIPGWKGTLLRDFFAMRYKLEVFVDNDVNCALLGELWCNSVLHKVQGGIAMLTLGTGLGGALAYQQRLMHGRHSLAGHFGRNLIWDQMANRLVSVETLVSGTGLHTIYHQLAMRQGVPAGETDMNGERIMKLAEQKQALALSTVDVWLDYLALQIHNLYWSFDPDMLVIGGGVIGSKQQWWSKLEQKITTMHVELSIVPAAMGNHAGVVGAAKLVWNGVA